MLLLCADIEQHALQQQCAVLGCVAQDQLSVRLARNALLLSVTCVIWTILGAMFVRAVYGLKSLGDGVSFMLLRLASGVLSGPEETVKDGKLMATSKERVVRVGGPARLIIHGNSAVVLEKAGKLTRVAKGIVDLGDFEKVWDVVDLRPQHWVHSVDAMTKDGIPVRCQADVSFQIDNGEKQPTQDEPYPATEHAIFAAATRKWMREAGRNEDDQTFDWARKAIIGVADGALRSILAQYTLDQVIGPDEADQNHQRSKIEAELRANLTALSGFGVKATRVELGDITVGDQVAQQRIKAWQSFWKRWALEREAKGEAKRLQYIEAAKAQAQADMIVAITEAFRSSTEATATIPSQLILLRMSEVLTHASFDSRGGRFFLPAEILQMIKEISLGANPKPTKNQDVPPASAETKRPAPKRALARLHIDRDLETFSQTEQQQLVTSIANKLKIPEDEIQVLYKIKESAFVILEMPDDAAIQLKKSCDNRDPDIAKLGITKIEVRLLSLPPHATIPQLAQPIQDFPNEQGIIHQLRNILIEHFSEDELRDLCFFELQDVPDMDYDSLPGTGKSNKIREMIAHCKRHGKLIHLIKTCQKFRPSVAWGIAFPSSDDSFTYAK